MTTNPRYRLIIIDDHPLIREGIRNYLNTTERFELIGEFSETRSVLNSGFSGIPQLIILDIDLPGIDGQKSFPLLKRKYPDCKIVAFTHYEHLETELKKTGFDGYCIKSERDSLLEALYAVMDGGKYFKTPVKATTPPARPFEDMNIHARLRMLTSRELEVAKHILQNYSNREIGDRIHISESTVETHRKHIKEKLNVKKNHELFTILRSIDFESKFST